MSIPTNISRENIISAIEKIDLEGIPTGADSQYYDVSYNNKLYPPKLVVSYANIFANGKELDRSSFGGGLNQPSFKLLESQGFDIVPKSDAPSLIDQSQSMAEDIIQKFKEFLFTKHRHESTSNQYIYYMPIIQKWFIDKGIVDSSFDIYRDTHLIKSINEQLESSFKDEWTNLNRNKNGWYSAPWNWWTKFNSTQQTTGTVTRSKKREEFRIASFQNKAKEAGLIFSDQLVKRFVASLWTKPFVICSGLSGSGKTKLAQAFAQWICGKDNSGGKNEQYCIIPVGADWTNREPLLGYPNALEDSKYVSPESGVLHLIIRAHKEPTKPFFLILDEMNLSHVERYFADFLSTMESGDAISLHNIENGKNSIPKQLSLPKNLFIVGTVNIDETTYMFSPKVLDRANAIEFRLREKDLVDFMNSNIPLNMEILSGQGETMSESFLESAKKPADKAFENTKDDLLRFFNELKKSGAEFGYRTLTEIGRLMSMLEQLGESGDNLLDIAIMQKLLPKLHGSRNKLTKTLVVLGGFCLSDNNKIKDGYLEKFLNNNLSEEEIKNDNNIRYKLSFEKICRMYKNAVENGFASYAEA